MTLDAVERESNWDAAGATDTSESLPGKRNRATDDAAGNSDEPPGNQEKRCRVGNLHSAPVVEKEVVKEAAQWRNPELAARWEATDASAAEGVGAATPAWTAEECSRFSGQELTEERGKLHGSLADAARARERAAGKISEVLQSVGGERPFQVY